MKITRPDKNTKTITFDSIQELVNYIDNTPTTPAYSSNPGSEGAGSSWYGTKDMPEARELLRTGWIDKSREIEQKLNDKIKKEPTPAIRQKSVYDVVGGNASVPRYLQGVPTNMIRQVRKPVKEKVITVNYACGFASRVTAEQIIEAAIDCLSYVNKLENSGTRVNVNTVWLVHHPEDSEKRFAWVVPVKKSSERLSIAKLAFTLCHPSMLRRIMFACLERDPEVPECWCWSYGRPIEDKATALELLPNTEFFNLS